jgi:hypothetical protein
MPSEGKGAKKRKVTMISRGVEISIAGGVGEMVRAISQASRRPLI